MISKKCVNILCQILLSCSGGSYQHVHIVQCFMLYLLNKRCDCKSQEQISQLNKRSSRSFC